MFQHPNLHKWFARMATPTRRVFGSFYTSNVLDLLRPSDDVPIHSHGPSRLMSAQAATWPIPAPDKAKKPR